MILFDDFLLLFGVFSVTFEPLFVTFQPLFFPFLPLSFPFSPTHPFSSDAAAALVGSLGLVPSLNTGDRHFMGEPVHGSAPDIEGKGVANPVAAILSGAMLLDAFNEPEKARLIEQSVSRVLESGVRTRDIGGEASTDDVTRAVCRAVSEAVSKL